MDFSLFSVEKRTRTIQYSNRKYGLAANVAIITVLASQLQVANSQLLKPKDKGSVSVQKSPSCGLAEVGKLEKSDDPTLGPRASI